MPPRIRSETPSDAESIPSPPRPSTSKLPKRAASPVDTASEASASEIEYDEVDADGSDEDSELNDYDEDDLAADYGAEPIPKPRSTVKPIKLKLNFGNSNAASSGMVKKSSRDDSLSSSHKGKGKAKRNDDDESDSLESDAEKGFSDASMASTVSGTRLTARQRGKEMGGENGMEFQSLPLKTTGKSSIKLTEAEVAKKKASRKSQVDKKLEDEKTETINRLLKKQVGRQRGAKSGTPSILPVANTTSVQPLVSNVRLTQPYRYISSIKSGEFVTTIQFPLHDSGIVAAKFTGYPGPRPPLKTRRLTTRDLKN